MIKNFLASAVGLRKETATIDAGTYADDDGLIKEGTVVQLDDGRYGIIFDEKDVTDGREDVVIGVVTAGHVLSDMVGFGELTKEDVIETAVAQGLFFESYKTAEYPADDNGEMEEYTPESEFGE